MKPPKLPACLAETRGNLDCNFFQSVLGNVPGAAHCLRFSSLYYQVGASVVHVAIFLQKVDLHKMILGCKHCLVYYTISKG